MIKKFIFLQISLKGNKIVDFHQPNDFAFQRLFRISHILVKKWNFCYLKSKHTIYILSKNVELRIFRPLY